MFNYKEVNIEKELRQYGTDLLIWNKNNFYWKIGMENSKKTVFT